MKVDNFEFERILNSGDVQRFHQVPRVRKQLISEHSWRVALLVQHIEPFCSKELLLAALTHDCAEIITGDIPATTKWNSPVLKEELDKIERDIENKWGVLYPLTDKEKDILKFCDMLEGMMYCCDRVEAGERKAFEPYSQWNHVIEKRFEQMNGVQSTLLTKVRLRMNKLMGFK